MEIEPKGYILHTNQKGYFENPFTYKNINQESKLILDEVVKNIILNNQNKIDSIYVRGSFASNSQVENYSDIDLIIIHNQPLENLPEYFTWKDSTVKLDLELMPIQSLQDLDKRFGTHFWIKTQSVHLYGKNLIPDIQDFKADKKSASKFGWKIPKLIKKTKIFLEKETGQSFKNRTRWICRAIIRASVTLFMDREKIYTRDLVYCYRYFSKYYPEYEPQMKTLLEQSINPTFTKEELLFFLDDFGLKLAEIIAEYHS